MTSIDGQGQGKDTEFKKRGIKAALSVNLNICANHKSLRNRPYFHFDLHAGCGWNHEVGVMGSPLAYLEAVYESGHPNAIGHFIEKDCGRANELARRKEISENRRMFVHNGDNGDFCPAIPDLIRAHGDDPKWAVGSILIDPNGPTGVPFDAISALVGICPRIDIIYNFSGTANKRLHSGHVAKVNAEAIPKIFAKKHWLIRAKIGSWQWSLLIGRNFKAGDHRALGFYHWDDPSGQRIVKELDTIGPVIDTELQLRLL